MFVIYDPETLTPSYTANVSSPDEYREAITKEGLSFVEIEQSVPINWISLSKDADGTIVVTVQEPTA